MKKGKRKSRVGDLNSNWKGGMTIEPSGRVLIRVNQKSVYRYRLVMEEQLGRKLKRVKLYIISIVLLMMTDLKIYKYCSKVNMQEYMV
jgi:hypothetical protein